jgi:predicted HTH transcriptional regulator
MKLRCSGCGAEAACECGVAYITAGELAAKAVKENPTMSARAIAEKFGLGNKTVSRARNETVSNDTVEKTIGLDGRARKKRKAQRNVSKNLPGMH